MTIQLFVELVDDIVLGEIILDSDNCTVDGECTDEAGSEFISDLLGRSGTWVRCSSDKNFRGGRPSVGYSFNRVRDTFLIEKPFPSFVLDALNKWVPPVPEPDSGSLTESNQYYDWDESVMNWVVMEDADS